MGTTVGEQKLSYLENRGTQGKEGPWVIVDILPLSGAPGLQLRDWPHEGFPRHYRLHPG